MRKIALLASVVLVLTGCAQSASPSGSPSISINISKSKSSSLGEDLTGSPTPSEQSSRPAPTSSKLAQSITDAQGHLATGANSQVTCEKGSTLFIGSQAQMEAPDLDELFLVIMVGCESNGVRGPSVPEVLHWRDGNWTSVATIRIKNYVVNPIGAFNKVNENKIRIKVQASPTKGGKTVTRTLEIRRENLSYWAEVLAS